MTGPDVSIIIIEYFSLDEVCLCISAIRENLEDVDHEIIVSSNSCYDRHKQEMIIRNYPNIIWVFNKTNGGFAEGMNQGLSRATGRYLAIANPDTLVIAGFSQMLKFMDTHPDIGAIGPQMIDTEGNIQDNCRPYVSIQNYVIRQLKRIIFRYDTILEKEFDYNRIQTVDWLIGAFMMVSRSAYELTNGLDKDYFMYGEDLDWCTRIRQKGFEIVYFTIMKIVYSGSRSARKINKHSWIFVKSHFKYWLKFGFFFGYPRKKEIKYDCICKLNQSLYKFDLCHFLSGE
jgi:N-acetylglucosaminyl-diphospho-decaprenol L-rhamnosyltransferase